MKFSELNLEPSLLSSIEKLGFQDCTPIQEQAIPLILARKDVSGLAQTGTGKTGAFAIPLINNILQEQKEGKWHARHFNLVLTPTRELAEQIFENVLKFGADSGIKAVSLYGGTAYEKQKEAIAQGVHFIIATPGRLIDLYKENVVDLKQVRAIAFDEADRMFDMGFKDDMKYILQRVPRERQYLVFSATLNFDVLNTAYYFGAEPIELNLSRDQAKAENVKDQIFHLGDDEKPKYLLTLLKNNNPGQTIIFSNFKNNIERIVKFLNSNNYPALAISSLLSQNQRNRVIEQFKRPNETNILVATDVAARGLDIQGVDLVINYELPMDSETYVHRIGRTGRAGTEGKAFSLVSDRDVESLARIEDYLGHKLETGWIEDTQFVQEFAAFPREEFSRERFEGGGAGGSGRRFQKDRPPRHRSDRGGDRGAGRGNDRGPGGDRGRSGERSERGPRREFKPSEARADQSLPENRQDQKPHGRDFKRDQTRDNKKSFDKNQQGGKGKFQGKNQGQRKERYSAGVYKPPQKKQAGIGQKITSFFKKLFS